jgi:hypothetical protein
MSDIVKLDLWGGVAVEYKSHKFIDFIDNITVNVNEILINYDSNEPFKQINFILWKIGSMTNENLSITMNDIHSNHYIQNKIIKIFDTIEEHKIKVMNIPYWCPFHSLEQHALYIMLRSCNMDIDKMKLKETILHLNQCDPYNTIKYNIKSTFWWEKDILKIIFACSNDAIKNLFLLEWNEFKTIHKRIKLVIEWLNTDWQESIKTSDINVQHTLDKILKNDTVIIRDILNEKNQDFLSFENLLLTSPETVDENIARKQKDYILQNDVY